MRPCIDYCEMLHRYYPLSHSRQCPLYLSLRQAPMPKNSFSTEEAVQVGMLIGVDFEKYGVEQFRMGMDVELEHGRRDPQTNVTDDDPIMTGKIALAHLKEFPDYYYRLSKMEKEGQQHWGTGSDED